MLKGLTQREFQELNLSVGKTTRARRPLSPLEVADLCAKAIDNGVGRTELTRALKMTDTGMVSKFLRLREIVPEVRHLVSWGYSGDAAIGFSVAAQLARLPLDKQAAAAEAIVKHRLTRDQMISVIQLLERSKQTLAECIRSGPESQPCRSCASVYPGSDYVRQDAIQAFVTFATQKRRASGGCCHPSISKGKGLHREAGH